MSPRLGHPVGFVLAAALELVPVTAGCSATERALFATEQTIEIDGPADGKPDAGTDIVRGGAGARVPWPPPAEALDPDVRFEWTQTLPGAGTCRAGAYTGAFRCTIDTPLPLILNGTIALTLGTTGERQELEITDGRLAGVDTTGADLLTADVFGSLDCDLNRFSAHSANGHAFPGTLVLPLRAFDQFDATLAGDFDSGSLTITGDFTMTNGVGADCVGTFSARWSP